MDGTAFSLHSQHLPLPSSLNSCARQSTPPPALFTGWVCESSTVHLWVFPTYICLQPMTQIPTTLPHVGSPKRRSWAVCFFLFWSPTSFLPQGPLGWIHFAEFLDQPGWMAGNILACYLPGDSVSPAASSQEPESNSLGSEEGVKRQPCAVAPWNDPGHWSEMDPGCETNPTTQQPCDLE